MVKFFANFKTPFFWPIFDAKKGIPQKSDSVKHNFIWVSNTMPKYRKNKSSNFKKAPR